MKRNLLIKVLRLDMRGLIDLGFQGNKFTWYNKRKDENAIYARPNRALANHKKVKYLF